MRQGVKQKHHHKKVKCIQRPAQKSSQHRRARRSYFCRRRLSHGLELRSHAANHCTGARAARPGKIPSTSCEFFTTATPFTSTNGIPSEKIEVIASAVDLSRFHPNRDKQKFRSEIGIPADVPVIVNVGMIRPDKGQLTLVEAARTVLQQYPEARFVFVGEGTGARKLGVRLREAINRYGLSERVLMLGYRWDIPDILAASDLVVIASIGTEASPIVLREALACGRPVVATRVGDIAEVIRDREHGLLVSPGSAEEMALAIMAEIVATRHGKDRTSVSAWKK